MHRVFHFMRLVFCDYASLRHSSFTLASLTTVNFLAATPRLIAKYFASNDKTFDILFFPRPLRERVG